MHWSDGSIYRGFWRKGLQHGLGIMIFSTGLRKAGFFDKNIFVKPITSKEELNRF